MKKAIIFARVSTKRQEQEGLSLRDIQLPKMRDYAKRNGLEVVKEYELSETADNKQRADFDDMVNFVRKNKDVGIIIAFRVDRITRNFRDAVAVDDLRMDYDKELHFVDDRLIIHRKSSSNEMMHWDTKVFLAKQFLNRLKEDAHNTRYSKLENGELPWGAPYGYKHLSDKKRNNDVIVDTFEKGIVQRVFTLYATGAYSDLSLSRKLKDDYGIKISKTSIWRMSKNRFYIGYMYDKETNTYYPHRYETIISEALFEKVQKIISGHSKKRYKYAGLPFVYRSLIRCKQCNCLLTPERKKKVQKNGNVHIYHYYHCTQRRGEHNAKWVTEKELDKQFTSVFKSFKIPQNENYSRGL